MISRISAVKLTDRNRARNRTIDMATYTASQRIAVERRRGKTQSKIMPGSAVVPCRVCSVLAVRVVRGAFLRFAWTWRT